MFSGLVQIIFDDLLKKSGLIFKAIDPNRTVFFSNDFDILITYDEREDEIYIDFDLSKYFEQKDLPNELEFPMYLNINDIYIQFEISLTDFADLKNNSIDERLKIKYKQFIAIWDKILCHKDYKNLLATLLINERVKLKNLKYFNKMKKDIAIAHELFKSKNYKKVYELLVQYKESLSEYDGKILDYSHKQIMT